MNTRNGQNEPRPEGRGYTGQQPTPWQGEQAGATSSIIPQSLQPGQFSLDSCRPLQWSGSVSPELERLAVTLEAGLEAGHIGGRFLAGLHLLISLVEYLGPAFNQVPKEQLRALMAAVVAGEQLAVDDLLTEIKAQAILGQALGQGKE